MSHEIESMFYRGETPWHGLGRQVVEAQTTEEAMKAAGLDWRIAAQPIYLADGTLLKNGKAIIRESDSKELGVVGPRTVPLQNADAFKWFDPWVQSGQVSLETAGSLQEGKRIWILARIGGDVGIVGDDVIRKFVLLSNAHDGTRACLAGLTPVRVVCANTERMAIRDKNSMLLRVKHSGRMLSALDDIQKSINLANQSFEATAEVYRRMASKGVNQKDLEKYVRVVLGYDVPEGQEISARAEEQVSKVLSLFETGKGNDLPGVKGTVWAAYNAVTEYLSHEAGRSASSRYDSLWFGKGSRINQLALDEAIKLAA